MYSYTATIGRNAPAFSGETREPIGQRPMSDVRWATFVDDVAEDMRRSAWEKQIECIEIHHGTGVWCGTDEDSAKITMLLKSALPEDGERSLTALRRYLSENARIYDQDAIALTIGISELC